MNNKTLRVILLLLGLTLTIAFALLLGCSPAEETVVVSHPAVDNMQADNDDSMESIADSAVPLAGPQGNVVSFVQVAVPVALAAPARPTATPAPAAPTASPETATPTPAAPTASPEEATPTPAAPTASPEEATPTPAAPTESPEEATPTPAAPTESPEEATPTPAAPTPTPVVTSTAASRLLERAQSLIAQFNACTTAAEKRELLGISNSNFSNDSFRKKLITDMGGTWENLEQEVIDATEYQQDKTLYVQVYIAGKSTDYEAVVYSTQNPDLSGNQWSTNLVYDDETELWMEYTQKHPYNDSRVGYSLVGLYNKEGGYDALKDTMETSDVWQPVEVPEAEEPAVEEASAPESPAPESPADSGVES